MSLAPNNHSSRSRFTVRLNLGGSPLMHAYTMLKELLGEMGAELTAEDLRPDLFGSCVATYANRDSLIRLVWDGKDGWGCVQEHRSGDSWVDVTDFLTEEDPESVPQNHVKIEQFRRVVAALLR